MKPAAISMIVPVLAIENLITIYHINPFSLLSKRQQKSTRRPINPDLN